MTATPLVLLHTLSDLAGKPAGLLFDASTADPASLQTLLTDERFQSLTGSAACVFRDGTDAALADALSTAGWAALAPGALVTANDRLDPSLATQGVRWAWGDWCMAPPAKPVGQQAASRALALQMVQLVTADADTHEIEALLRQDPTLSYHLLRLVNSLGMGVTRRITSFSQAILILGRAQLRRWLNLMLFASRQGDPRSAMLLARVSVRARALELLARAAGLDKTTQDQAFMTGMFSLLGILFGMPTAEVLAPLSIAEAVQAALLRHEGDLGALLALVEDAERGQFDSLRERLDRLQIPADAFNAAMAEATLWMFGTVRETQGAGHA